jgi:hypothetical protein
MHLTLGHIRQLAKQLQLDRLLVLTRLRVTEEQTNTTDTSALLVFRCVGNECSTLERTFDSDKHFAEGKGKGRLKG